MSRLLGHDPINDMRVAIQAVRDAEKRVADLERARREPPGMIWMAEYREAKRSLERVALYYGTLVAAEASEAE